MTYSSCAEDCAGYDFFGVEYGSQCRCGNGFSNPSSQAPESDCSMPCAGDPTTMCGAGNRMNVFKSLNSSAGIPANTTLPGYNYSGCYTDDVNARTLTGATQGSDDMTLEMCASFCKGYVYFGAEYANECYCGNAFANPTQLTPAGDCSYLCAGNATELCGAGNRLSVYQATT